MVRPASRVKINDNFAPIIVVALVAILLMVPAQSLFAARPPPKVYNLTLGATSLHTADGIDSSDIEAFATDRRGKPVTAANMVIVVFSNAPGFRDLVTELDVTNSGGGFYTASYATKSAGSYIVRATDLTSGRTAETVIEFVPGSLTAIQLVEIRGPIYHPSLGRSYDLSVRAVDAHANPRDDVLLEWSTSLGQLTDLGFDASNQTYNYRLSCGWYGIADVHIEDDNNAASYDLQVRFTTAEIDWERGILHPVNAVAPEIGAENASNLTIPLSLFNASLNPQVGSFQTTLLYDPLSLQFTGITDPNPLDQFEPQAHELTPGEISIFAGALSIDDIQYIQAADVHFTSLTEGETTIVIQETTLFDEDTIEITIIEDTLPPITTVTVKPTVEIPVTFWIVEGAATLTQVTDDIAQTNQIFKDLADKCICDKYLKIEVVGVNIMSNKQWNDIDKDRDNNLDDNEKGSLPNDPASTTDVFYVPGIQSGKETGILGISYLNGPVAVVNSLDTDGRTLGHELSHSWSDNAIDDQGGSDAPLQGANDRGNLMNYDNTGDTLTPTQCDLIKWTQ